MIAYLALAAAAVATAPGALPALAVALHALAPYLVAGLWAYALWLAHRADARQYHRHGRPDVHHHIRPTRRHRVRLALQRLVSLRIRITTRTNARTAS